MENKLWLAIMLAILASANMNVGKAIQKWKVKVLGQGLKALSQENRRDLGIWAIGIVLTVSAAPLFSIALNYTDKPSMVSSMNGVGIIGLVLFAWLVLKEKVGVQEMAGAALVFTGATVMGAFEKAAGKEQFYVIEGFFFIWPLMLAVAGPAAYISWRTRKLHGFTFGLLVGLLMGSAVILGKVALIEANHSFWGQLANIYPYFALVVGLAALILTQFAFWRSTAMVVVPTINSVMILTPAAIEYFTFMKTLQPLQYAGIAAIVAGVILLTYTEAQDRIEGQEQEAQETEATPARAG